MFHVAKSERPGGIFATLRLWKTWFLRWGSCRRRTWCATLSALPLCLNTFQGLVQLANAVGYHWNPGVTKGILTVLSGSQKNLAPNRTTPGFLATEDLSIFTESTQVLLRIVHPCHSLSNSEDPVDSLHLAVAESSLLKLLFSHTSHPPRSASVFLCCCLLRLIYLWKYFWPLKTCFEYGDVNVTKLHGYKTGSFVVTRITHCQCCAWKNIHSHQ